MNEAVASPSSNGSVMPAQDGQTGRANAHPDELRDTPSIAFVGDDGFRGFKPSRGLPPTPDGLGANGVFLLER
jgi:hypothetical protein